MKLGETCTTRCIYRADGLCSEASPQPVQSLQPSQVPLQFPSSLIRNRSFTEALCVGLHVLSCFSFLAKMNCEYSASALFLGSRSGGDIPCPDSIVTDLRLACKCSLSTEKPRAAGSDLLLALVRLGLQVLCRMHVRIWQH